VDHVDSNEQQTGIIHINIHYIIYNKFVVTFYLPNNTISPDNNYISVHLTAPELEIIAEL
jgi:uncharacterized membrane protein